MPVALAAPSPIRSTAIRTPAAGDRLTRRRSPLLGARERAARLSVRRPGVGRGRRRPGHPGAKISCLFG